MCEPGENWWNQSKISQILKFGLCVFRAGKAIEAWGLIRIKSQWRKRLRGALFTQVA